MARPREVGQGLPLDTEVLARQLSDIFDAELARLRIDSVEKPPGPRAPPPCRRSAAHRPDVPPTAARRRGRPGRSGARHRRSEEGGAPVPAVTAPAAMLMTRRTAMATARGTACSPEGLRTRHARRRRLQ